MNPIGHAGKKFSVSHDTFGEYGRDFNSLSAARKSLADPELTSPESYTIIERHLKNDRWMKVATHPSRISK